MQIIGRRSNICSLFIPGNWSRLPSKEIQMAPKFNPFMAYVQNFKTTLSTNEQKSISLKVLIGKLTPLWNGMPEEEKKQYQILANELNSNAGQTIKPRPRVDIEADTNDFYKMQKYVKSLLDMISDKNELLDKKFIILHINCHSHNAEQYYFPAEIAALEFNLKNGIHRTYHQIIGLSKNYPRGFAGGMREYSDKFHQISCWVDHPDDYERIFSEFISFIKNEKYHVTMCEDLPYIYTLETDIGFDMMKAKRGLERLYRTAYSKNHKETEDCHHCERVFNIGSLEYLFNEICTKMDIPRDILLSTTAHDILERDMYGCGLGCAYHEIRDIAFKCSKARVLQWVSNICKFIHEYTGLYLIPGKHMAIQLKNGSKMIIENKELPLSRYDLNHDLEDYCLNWMTNLSIESSSCKP